MAKDKSSVLSTPLAYITYLVVILGVGAHIVPLVSPQIMASGFAGIIFFLKIFGVIGLISLLIMFLELLNYFGLERHNIMGLTLGLSIAFVFMYVDREMTILKPIEEFSIDARFRLTGPSVTFVKRENVTLQSSNPDAHPAIQIIGIDQDTINKLQIFPFSWHHYANMLSALEGSTASSVMFDIFLLDELKNNYGLLALSEDMRDDMYTSLRTNKSITLSNSQIRKASALLSNQIKTNGNVVLDYPFQTSGLNEETLSRKVLEEREKFLERYEIINVEESEYNSKREWVDHPEPPIASIGESSMGLGYANIRKGETGVNRTVPLIIKYKNRFYPSIDLIMAARHYGINIKKDVSVKLGEYIKISNIPEKTRSYFIGGKSESMDVMAKPNSKREIKIPVDEEGFMAINFIGGPLSFSSTSFWMISESEKGYYSGDSDAFADKILLLSVYYATGVAHDVHASPFGDLMGIEHHAAGLNTILNQDFLKFAPLWLNYLILIIIGLIFGFIVPRYNIKWVLVGTVVLALVFTVEALYVFSQFNFVHFFFTPYIEMVIVLIAITGYKVLTEEENVKYIRSTFSKFVSKDVVNEMLANPDSLKLGGANKELTIFFSDIRGFTSISEALSPEDLVLLLNDYLSVMTETVIAYKGTVDKYMGDAIMAFWGAPLEIKEHAYYACISSLRQLQQLNELQIKWKEQGWPSIEIGIGLNTGMAVAGNMGSSHRMDYTVMGDTINLGSRLEGTNKVYATRIIISEHTYAKVKDKIVSRELDSIRVKGKNEPVTIYELIDIKDHGDYEKYIKLVTN
ncbi:MAG: adenylate/guanylate cyclase domain-containing protein [Leptospirales bacterium]